MHASRVTGQTVDVAVLPEAEAPGTFHHYCSVSDRQAASIFASGASRPRSLHRNSAAKLALHPKPGPPDYLSAQSVICLVRLCK